MECFKMVASIFVVFLHIPFPGRLQRLINVLANCAVPLFFAITGYFNFGADRQAIIRRLKHLLRLYLTAIVISVALGIVSTELVGGSSIAFIRSYWPDGQEFMNWLVLQQDPRNGQLWYLSSVCLCYVVLYLYVRFWENTPVNYRPLYYAAFSFFSVFFALGCLFPVAGAEVPYRLYRNGFYFGFPMFVFGMFLREYQEKILEAFRLSSGKLLGLALVGSALAIAQYFTLGMGQMALGTLLEVPALLLFMVCHPSVAKEQGFCAACIGKFGAWSTYVYILHIQVSLIYTKFCRYPILAYLSENAEAWLQPLIVAAMSLVGAIALTRVGEILHRISRRHRKNSLFRY